MSAIAGLFNYDEGPASRDSIERMTRALSVFGQHGERTVTLGAAALGISNLWMTKEDAFRPQPVNSRDGRFAMVFDGRIDNRDDLAESLAMSAADIGELSDAQLMMRAFECWGEDAFTRTVADFAIIMWDIRDRTMMLATDPFGVRGIYYYSDSSGFYAASMPRGLLALPEIPRELNEERIADALCQLLVEPTKSAYQGINAVPAGSVLTVHQDAIRTRRYYQLSDFVKPVHYAKDSDYVEAGQELLNKAVSARLRTQHKVGAFMSGGLDSSTVAVTASRYLEMQSKRLPTFTWVPQDDWDGQTEPHCYGDETPYVQAIAERHPNIDLNLIQATGRGHYYRQDEFLRLVELPMRATAIMGWVHTILEQAKEQGIRVMTVGDSGDMTLSYRGDGIYFDLFRRGRWLKMMRELWAREPGTRGLIRGLYLNVLPGLFSNTGWDTLNRLRNRPTLEQRWLRFSTALKSFGEEMHVPERARASHFDYWGRPPVAGRSFWRNTMEQQGGGDFPIKQALAAIYGIELRDPLGDRRIKEWCFGVPEEQFHRAGSPRRLIKRIMDGQIPDKVLHKQQLVGRLNSDWQVRMAHDLPRMRNDLAAMRDDPDLARMVDVDRLEGWIDQWPDHTITAPTDDRRFTLGVNLPMAMSTARFVELFKGRNR